MKNPFSNAHLIGENYNPADYQMKGRRGFNTYVMSRSSLKDFAECPSRWIKGGGSMVEESDSTRWGSLVDCLVTSPARFDQLFAVKPLTYQNDEGEEKPWNANSKTCRKWLFDNADKICISSETHTQAHRAADSLLNNPSLKGIFNASDFQVYLMADYKDSETGITIPVCALLDIVPKGRSIKDLKTARNANPSKWPRLCHEFWYDAQAALYLDIYNAATGEDRDEFDHIIQESEPPFEVSHVTLSVEFINHGRRKYTNALRLYCQCLASGHWATYNDLQKNNFGGRALVEPESWMIESMTSDDPDWMKAA